MVVPTTYRKRPYRKKRGYARKGARRGAVYGAAAGQLWKDVKMLKNLVNVEFKVYDTNTSAEVLTSTGFFVGLNNISQGDTVNSRDGNSMRMKSLQCDGSLVRGSVDANVNLVWILDLQPTNGIPTLSTVFDTVAGDVTCSLRNLSNRSRFMILKEERVFLTSNNPHYLIDYYRKLDAKVFFSDATSTYTSVRKNGLFFLAYTSVAANGPTLNCKNRIRFIDN